jgi:hypothetical protein
MPHGFFLPTPSRPGEGDVLVDVNAFIGEYPFRKVPGGSVDELLAAMDRVEIGEAWVSYLPAVFWRDPMEGNALLYDALADSHRVRPVPAVHPGLPTWRRHLDEVLGRGAPAVRCDPMFYALDPMSEEMGCFLEACGSAGVPVLMAVRLEDGRQRHPNDSAGDLAPWHIRAFVRRDPAVRVLVTGADRGFIEQVHFGSTPTESERVWWDISWIWGPPEDDLATLLETVGVERFVFGTGQPLRLPEASLAKLDLIDRDGGGAWRSAVEADNARRAFNG